MGAWFAETTVEGFVPSVPGAVAMTRSILQARERELAARLKKTQDQAFGVGGHQLHGGHAWNPLTALTIEIKTKLGVSRPAAPLYRTGFMSKHQRVRVRLVQLPGGLRFQLFAQNTAWYSRFHDSGFRHVWSGKMVSPRHPVEWTPQDLEWAVASLRSFMVGGEVAKRRKSNTLKSKLSRAGMGPQKLWSRMRLPG